MTRPDHDGVTIPGVDFRLEPGHPLPLGASVRRQGVNFSLYSSQATSVTLVVIPKGTHNVLEFPLDPFRHRTGDVWHAFLRGLDPNARYGYRVDAQPNPDAIRFPFDSTKILLDPYGRAISGGASWGTGARRRLSRVEDEFFDWQGDRFPNRHMADSIIYELHIRGFTKHPSSGVSNPGTFLGVVEKIPYLLDLGVTAIELMPVTEFDECDNPRTNPLTGEKLLNLWGYHPLSFFAPKAGYAAYGAQGQQIREFRTMVRELHRAGIEVILDMVFNHTGEGEDRTLCYRGLDNPTYYLLEPDGRYSNFSGCGNTLNCNHPIVRDLILESLRYWVTEMHVDGFRFDLAAILGRGRNGEVLSNPPLLEHITADPVLAHTKLIAEAWDAAGLYQVGSFPNWGRWAEWNGRFRDDLRRFVRGDAGLVSALATRLCGSPDLYQTDRAPYHSVNFVSCHDGFPIRDLYSYSRKHNEANGEGNRDGGNDDHSWNCGVEGPTDDPDILALRGRLSRNLAALLLLAQGVPMILAGDEFGRSQEGNNNAYCQDNLISWLNWDLLSENRNLYRFFRLLIAFRKRHPVLRGHHFAGSGRCHTPDLIWHGMQPLRPDWGQDCRTIAMQISGCQVDPDIYLAINSHCEPLDFILPDPVSPMRWHRIVDTFLPPPEDIWEEEDAPALPFPFTYTIGPRSLVLLISR